MKNSVNKHRVLCYFSIFSIMLIYSAQGKVPQESSKLNAETMLNEFVENYRHKVADTLSFVVQFDIQPNNQLWHVIIESGKQVKLEKGPDNRALVTFTTTLDSLRLIYEGRMTALTAAGKASGSDSAPLDLNLPEGFEFTPDVRLKLFDFVQHFFNRSVPEKVLLGEEYSRLVHGANVITLYYHQGFRSAWYMVKKNQRLNEPGDTNPFPQAFIFFSGQGFAKIGNETIKVKAGESYYIPPDSDHMVWTENEEPLVLIWLAWGKGA